MSATHELAWAAGFFDGEGCTTARFVRSDRIRPCDLRIAVVQTDLEVLRRFQRAVLGCGSIRPRRVLRGKPMWVWTAQNFEEVQATMAALWRYLSEPKRRQVLSVFRRLDFNDRRRQRRTLLTECRRGHSLADAMVDKYGWRHCRTCHRLDERERRKRRK